jgi:hypothetical protein
VQQWYTGFAIEIDDNGEENQDTAHSFQISRSAKPK